jgi:hypothetical protein
MPTFVKIGGASNITINAPTGDAWELTGLDANGNVLQEINVQVLTGDTPLNPCEILLPTPESLNYRKVTFNIVNKGTGGTIINLNGQDATINGFGTIQTNGNTSFPYILTLIDENTWSLPVPLEP